LTGIIDFGLLFNNYLIISNASREGARTAAVGAADTDIIELVTELTSTVDQSKLSISVSPVESMRKNGDKVVVTVKYDNSLITPIISSFIPNPVHLQAVTTMRVE